MNYREYLSRPLSKYFLDELVSYIFENPSDFDDFYPLIFEYDKKIAWRAAWSCVKLSEQKPEWFTDHNFKEISILAITTFHGGLKRECLSILFNLPLPNPISVDLINACFEWMVAQKSPIAVQALSMKLLLRICQIEPDFKPELMATLENIDVENYSAGFKSTRNNVLKNLTYN